MSLVFYAISYALGLATGLAGYWFVTLTRRSPANRPWLLVNGQAFDDLGTACEFADWLENQGRKIEFCVRDTIPED